MVSRWESGAVTDSDALVDLENNIGERYEEKGDCVESISSRSGTGDSVCGSRGLPLSTWRSTVGTRTAEGLSDNRGREKAYHRGLDSDDSDAGDYDNSRMPSVDNEIQFESKDASTYSAQMHTYESPIIASATDGVVNNGNINTTPFDTLSRRPLEYYQLGGPRPTSPNRSTGCITIGAPQSPSKPPVPIQSSQTTFTQPVPTRSELELLAAHTDSIHPSFEVTIEDPKHSPQLPVITELPPHVIKQTSFNVATVTKADQQTPSSNTSVQQKPTALVDPFDDYSESESV